MTEAVMCPECGADMRLRTARKGANAGNQFWGCTRYPSCKGTRPLDGEAEGVRTSGSDPTQVATPRVNWVDGIRRPDWQTRYIVGGARLRAWDAVTARRLKPSLVRAASHAVLLMSGDPERATPAATQVADTIRRILARGDRPPIDHDVEMAALETAGLSGRLRSALDKRDLSMRIRAGSSLPDTAAVEAALVYRVPFEYDDDTIEALRAGSDSDDEADLLTKVIPDELDPQLLHWAHPQAPFDSLTASSVTVSTLRRTDLLVAHPSIDPFVVEIDGRQHELQQDEDRGRDAELKRAGVQTYRIPTASPGAAVERLASVIADAPLDGVEPRRSDLALVWAAPIAARIVRALAEALGAGWLMGTTWRIELHEPVGIAVAAVRSALELIDSVSEVWSADVAPSEVHLTTPDASTTLVRLGPGAYESDDSLSSSGDPDLRVHIEPFAGVLHRLPELDGTPTVVIRSAALPVDLADLVGGQTGERYVDDPDAISSEALARLLRYLFGKREFLPLDTPQPRGQERAIRRLLGGKDTVVLLPTGAGKSLIYQMAGLLLPGRTLIVDPINALIDDQLDGLRLQGIDRAIGITKADRAQGTFEAKLDRVRSGDAYFCFVSPERLQQQVFRETVRSLTLSTPINIAVVDEAHCVSEWGHDFRTAYLDLGQVLRRVTTSEDGIAPPILGLTGTASRSVLRDMLIELGIERADPMAIVVPTDFDRPELTFEVVGSSEGEVASRIFGILTKLATRERMSLGEYLAPAGEESRCGIVFCQRVDGPNSITWLSRDLGSLLGVPPPVYGGRPPKRLRESAGGAARWEADKRNNAESFKDNRATILVATKAYGMGIDKPNVRFIVHAGLSGSIEGYYQEAGRAGRDRLASHCVIVHYPGDDEFHGWAHGNTFRGVEADLADVRDLMASIGAIDEPRVVKVPFGMDDDAVERAIHRLKLLGVVTDYLVDWSSREFHVTVGEVTHASVDAALVSYVGRSQPGRVRVIEDAIRREQHATLQDRVLAHAHRLVEFVYDTVVSARERAIAEMRSLAETAKGDAAIRSRILDYLQLGKVAHQLEELMDLDPFRFEPWLDLYDSIDTLEDAREWRGATSRFLESSPDHPGLLIGRALAEAVVPEGSDAAFGTELRAALVSATTRYAVKRQAAVAVVSHLLEWVHRRRSRWTGLVFEASDSAIGPDRGGWFEEQERRFLRDKNTDAHEMGAILARRIAWQADQLRAVAAALHEVN